jgi:enterochelin esterase-like enzyme
VEGEDGGCERDGSPSGDGRLRRHVAGRVEHAEDTRFRAENELLDRELEAARVPHVFRVYSGAHDQSVWQAHARAWLSLALHHLRRPTGG